MPSATAEVIPELPRLVPDGVWRPLRSGADPALQRALERRLADDRRWPGLVREGRLAIGLVDLTEIAAPRYASVNGEQMMYAASLPKIALLLAAYQAFEDGRLAPTELITEDLGDMIRVSDNRAATRMLERLGHGYVATVVADPRWQLFDLQRGGGLWVGKPYATTGPRIGDPLHGFSHGANVAQTCRFYYLLATGRLIGPERSRQMLEVLVDSELHHKFVYALERRAPSARLFRKSGTWRTWHCDSALVWGPDWRRYILVAMVQHEDGEEIMQKLLVATDELLAPGSR